MTVREWLNRNYKLAKELETKSACLETIINITSKTDRDFIVGHSDNSQEIKFMRWSSLKEEVEHLTKEVEAVDKETDFILRHLEDSDEYRVLYCRYVRRMEWRDIKSTFGYSKSSMFRAHNDGINHVANLVNGQFSKYF